MIVCHCNRIDHTDIERTANELTAIDRWRLLTPVAVYHALGKRPRCGGCLPLATSIIHSRLVSEVTPCEPCPFAELASMPRPAVPHENQGRILEAAE